MTALKRPKLARRRRNGGKKENLEQLYLVSGSFPDQTQVLVIYVQTTLKLASFPDSPTLENEH